MKNTFFIFLSLFMVCSGMTQDLPPVINYGPNQYSAGNQNWMIAEDDHNNLYFANSTGLLEFNGENWKNYPVPNNTIVRSVRVIKDRIYTGAYMEVGYWTRNNLGGLSYTSLLPKLRKKVNDGEQFWDIEEVDGLVIFRSFGGIYLFDEKKDEFSKMLNPEEKPISGIFNLNNQLYFQYVGGGLFKVENGQAIEVIPYDVLGNNLVMHLYDTGDGKLSMITGNSGFFNWDGNRLNQFNETLSQTIKYPNTLSALHLKNGEIVLGTVGEGIIHIDAAGKILNTFNQNNVLENNTVLNLFEDNNSNIWAGLDYGISMLDYTSEIRSFYDNKGKIGSVYASFSKGSQLYLGTNQGLYVRNDASEEFKLIEGTNGQVWFIDEIDGRIFCGHNNGTFLIRNEQAKKISNRLGTWTIRKLDDRTYVQGHYNGISFLQIDGANFEDTPLLDNFPHSSKFIEIDSENRLWVSNEHKGVFKIQLSDSLFKNPQILKNYRFEEESGITSSIFRFQDTLYYSAVNEIYQYNQSTDSFSRENRLNELVFKENRISGKMLGLSDNSELFGFAENKILRIKPTQLNSNYGLDYIYIDQTFRNIALGYENISRLSTNEYLLGISNGFIRLSLPLNPPEFGKLRFSQISVNTLDSKAVSVPFDPDGEFDFANNNINFSFSTPVHDKFLKPEYSYRLLGLSERWSAWNTVPEASFKNLDFGEYIFEVRSRIGNEESETLSYNFKINRPYYLSNLAIVIYSLLFAGILFLLHIIYKKYHQKQVADNERALKMKNLEAEREIIKLRNEKLEQDMANKNRELAVSTMSLIKKNEFLSSIKDRLRDSEDSTKIKSVIRTIDKDISEEDNWKFFKKAFNNADKDFFKKVKSKHPELTSNDLKLCAYLRLNLSSKEIAPLLNISLKSVEIKRYRLRKKMDLDRETNLTDYILGL